MSYIDPRCKKCRHLTGQVCAAGLICFNYDKYEPRNMTDGEILSNLAGKPTGIDDDVITGVKETIDEVIAEDGSVKFVKTRILDSGERREFASGAVRDIQEGKGRCDLLPLDVVAYCLQDDEILHWICKFQNSGLIDCLFEIFPLTFRCRMFDDVYTMLLEVSKHFEEGAKKYGEDNWQKGIDVHCYIDSAVRHYLKFLRGDQDEPHDRAFCWNILCAIWTCKHKPELNEYGRRYDKAMDEVKDGLSKAFQLPKSILFASNTD